MCVCKKVLTWESSYTHRTRLYIWQLSIPQVPGQGDLFARAARRYGARDARGVQRDRARKDVRSAARFRRFWYSKMRGADIILESNWKARRPTKMVDIINLEQAAWFFFPSFYFNALQEWHNDLRERNLKKRWHRMKSIFIESFNRLKINKIL